MKQFSDYDLPREAAKIIQQHLIEQGYLELNSPPRGMPGKKSDEAFQEWIYGEVSADDRRPQTSFTATVLNVASEFVGMREIKPNKEWDDTGTPGPDPEKSADLRAMMRPSPWVPGWAYCAAFAEGVYIRALELYGANRNTLNRFKTLMTPHVVTSANNFRAAGLLRDRPEPGAIWLAQKGVSSNGHAGLVVSISHPNMTTIEANTGPGEEAHAEGVTREGDWIDRKTRSIYQNGVFKTLGFIWPGDIIRL